MVATTMPPNPPLLLAATALLAALLVGAAYLALDQPNDPVIDETFLDPASCRPLLLRHAGGGPVVPADAHWWVDGDGRPSPEVRNGTWPLGPGETVDLGRPGRLVHVQTPDWNHTVDTRCSGT